MSEKQYDDFEAMSSTTSDPGHARDDEPEDDFDQEALNRAQFVDEVENGIGICLANLEIGLPADHEIDCSGYDVDTDAIVSKLYQGLQRINEDLDPRTLYRCSATVKNGTLRIRIVHNRK